MFNSGSFTAGLFRDRVEHACSARSGDTLRRNDPARFQRVGPDEIGRGMALVRAGSPAAPRQ